SMASSSEPRFARACLGSSASSPAASITTTWSVSTAGGWWRSTIRDSSGRSIACLSGSGAASSITTWCCAAPAGTATKRLPGVDPGAALPRPRPPGAGPFREQHGDPAPAVRRVDHVVDLSVGGHADALAAVVGGGDGRLEDALTLGRILDRVGLHSRAVTYTA